MNWIEYADPSNWHEAASVFPLMPDDDLQKLADDVKANGLKNAIILLDNKVLDGRNRLLACKLAGVRPHLESRNAEKLGSPVSWVLSQNLHRRQLTATQRAFVAVEAEKLFAVEAKERQKTLNNAGGKNATSGTGKARDKAANACDVSARYVQDAKAVAVKSPAVAAQAKAGKFTMAEAKALHSLQKTNPDIAARVLKGDLKLREAKRMTAVKPMREKYSEQDYFGRIGRMLATTLIDQRLTDLANMKKKDFTPEAKEGLTKLILNLRDVEKRALAHADAFKAVLKRCQ